ncbi:MFS transporter [Sphingopyxis indica]|uniref:MFS transporter n=1 Tax=Sphingopyxis indica TaxID=436663 RepID=UPI002938E499|nr:MFS transporter [Sphingopyxis indica]WOF43049.1 MFS transporter [Sphingopyxis indica]
MTHAHGLRRWQVIAYCAPAVPFAMLSAPALTIIPALYLSWSDIGTKTLAAGLLVTNIAHAAALPAAGMISDRFSANPHNRVILLCCAMALAGVAWWQWLAIDAHEAAAAFIGWSLLLVTADAVFETNHPALAADLAPRDDGRLLLLSARSIGSVAGYFCCFALLEWQRGADRIGRAAVQWLTRSTIVLLAAAAAALCLLAVRSANSSTKVTAVSRNPVGGRFARTRQILLNHGVRSLLAVTGAQSLASGMTAGLIYAFMDRALGIAWAAPQIFMAGAAVSILTAMACPALARRFSFRAIIAGSATVAASVNVAMGLLPFVGGGREAVMILFGIAALANTPSTIAVSTLMARFVRPSEESGTGSLLGTAYGLSAATNLVATAVGAALTVHLLPEKGTSSPAFFLATIGLAPAGCLVIAALLANRLLPREIPDPAERNP